MLAEEWQGSMLNLNLCPPTANGNDAGATSKQAKRRSLLPQFARKVLGEQTIQEDEVLEEAQSGGDTAGTSSSESEPRKAVELADRRAMPPPSRLTRPTSVYSAGGLGRTPSVRSSARGATQSVDARADALAALTGSAPLPPPKPVATTEAGLKRTSSIRLPQTQPSATGLSRTTSVKSRQPPPRTSSIARTISTTIPEKRSSMTGKPRPPSIDGKVTARPPSIISPTSPASSTTSRQSSTRPQSQVLMPPPSRPTFSTYQQHYSPATSALTKPPLPPTRSSKPAIVTEEDTAPSFETVKQQIELLQLSLLHQAAQQTTQEYEASAKTKLGRKQAKLRKEYEALRAREDEQQRMASLIALDAWCPDTALLAENLQILSRLYSELTALTEPTGRYALLVSTFESWIEGVQAIFTGHRAPAFVEALPHDWHKAHTSLALRLRALQRDLGLLPPVSVEDEESVGLHVLLSSCGTLLDGMLKELEMMSKLERECLLRAKARVDEEVQALTLDVGAVEGKKWVPAWQSVM